MMSVVHDQDGLRTVLNYTIGLLCRNSMQFDHELKVQGLLGITLDNNRVLLLNFDEKYSRTAQNSTTNVDQSEQVVQNNDTVSAGYKDSEPIRLKPHANKHVFDCQQESSKKTPSVTQNDIQHEHQLENIGKQNHANASSVQSVEPTDIGSLKNLPNLHSMPLVSHCSSAIQKRDETSLPLILKVEDHISLSDSGSDFEFGRDSDSHDPPDNRNIVVPTSKVARVLVATKSEPIVVEPTTRTNDARGSESLELLPNMDCTADAQLDDKLFVGSSNNAEQTWQPAPSSHNGSSSSADDFDGSYFQQCNAANELVNVQNRQSRAALFRLHACDYVGCNKRFTNRRHMLRHQTLKHGRRPRIRISSGYMLDQMNAFDGSCLEGLSSYDDEEDETIVNLPVPVRAVNDSEIDPNNFRFSMRNSSIPLTVSAENDDCFAGHSAASGSYNRLLPAFVNGISFQGK